MSVSSTSMPCIPYCHMCNVMITWSSALLFVHQLTASQKWQRPDRRNPGPAPAARKTGFLSAQGLLQPGRFVEFSSLVPYSATAWLVLASATGQLNYSQMPVAKALSIKCFVVQQSLRALFLPNEGAPAGTGRLLTMAGVFTDHEATVLDVTPSWADCSGLLADPAECWQHRFRHTIMSSIRPMPLSVIMRSLRR